MTTICKMTYKDFVDEVDVDEYVVDGHEQTKVTVGERIYLVSGHHRLVNLYKILRDKYCHRCNCTAQKIEM